MFFVGATRGALFFKDVWRVMVERIAPSATQASRKLGLVVGLVASSCAVDVVTVDRKTHAFFVLNELCRSHSGHGGALAVVKEVVESEWARVEQRFFLIGISFGVPCRRELLAFRRRRLHVLVIFCELEERIDVHVLFSKQIICVFGDSFVHPPAGGAPLRFQALDIMCHVEATMG